MNRPVCFLLLLIASATTLAAEIHRCRDAKGRISYSDRPCPASAESLETRSMSGQKLQAAGITAQCDREGDDWQTLGEDFQSTLQTLPAKQQEATRSALLGLGQARVGSEPRWRRSSRGDLHFCIPSDTGATIEVVAGHGGELVTFDEQKSRYINDPADPMNVLSRCSAAVTGCFNPPEMSMDRCVDAVPTCSGTASQGSPDCCPYQCKDAYHAARSSGSDPIGALQSVLFGDDSCVPGVKQRLGG